MTKRTRKIVKASTISSHKRGYFVFSGTTRHPRLKYYATKKSAKKHIRGKPD